MKMKMKILHFSFCISCAKAHFEVPSPPKPDSLTDFKKIPFAKIKNGLWTAQYEGNPITIWGVIVLGEWFGET